jgi:predicted LPLAT superfamily acyltransferase
MHVPPMSKNSVHGARTGYLPDGEHPEWMHRKERGSIFWLRVMRWLSLNLGRRLSRLVVFGIAGYFLLAVPVARRASRSYLGRCLERSVTALDLYRHFLAFASTIHDRVYLLNDRHDLFEIRTTGAELLFELQAAKKGALLLGAHLGSFEVLRTLARNDPRLHVCMAMYPENAQQINRALLAINPQVSSNIITLGRVDAILAIHNQLAAGAMVGVLADRAAGLDQYISRTFLGAPAHFPSGPFRVAAMLRPPVYFMAGLYGGGNRYDVHFERLADFSAVANANRDVVIGELLDSYVAALERHCRAAAYNWFNYYDFWGEGH